MEYDNLISFNSFHVDRFVCLSKEENGRQNIETDNEPNQIIMIVHF